MILAPSPVDLILQQCSRLTLRECDHCGDAAAKLAVLSLCLGWGADEERE